MIANISYDVPVQVLVDLDTREVLRVVVIDEALQEDPLGHCAISNQGDKQITEEQRRAAYEIAGATDEWPLWDIGW